VGELHIVEEAACWERKFMLFKVYLRQSVGMSSRTKPSKNVRPLKMQKSQNIGKGVFFKLN